MNYDAYRPSAREWVIIIGEYMIIISIITCLFYDSFIGIAIFAPGFILFERYERNRRCQKRREEMSNEFIKSLRSISTSLAAGFSPERAFEDAYDEMERMYGKSGLITREIASINNQVRAGIRIEDALNDFAKRTNIDEIKDFALIFGIAKVSGGSFSRIISSCSELMEMQRETVMEAKVVIRGKQYEQRIMTVIPLGIIIYLKISSGSFIEVLYHNVTGILVMTACLFLYILSIYLSERIVAINV